MKMKFVVRSVRCSKIFSTLEAAVDACRLDIGEPCASSMQMMRLLIDGRIQLQVGSDFMFMCKAVDSWTKEHSLADDLQYVQMFVCEEV